MDWLEIKEFFKDTSKIIIFVIIVLVLVVYVFSITQVVGSSMYPTLKDGEVLILNKFKYRISDIERGDIVSLRYADTKYFIKRIIGMPGENVYIKDNKLYIDDEEFIESYISDELEYDDFDLSSLGYDKIPQDMYLVLGDNRPDSVDSREIGLIKKDEIIGKISIRIWPLNKLKLIK